MCRITVASFGSGSDLSLGLKIRYDLMKMRLSKKGLFKEQSYYLAAPHDKLKTEMQSETIWVVLTWPVLSTITICREAFLVEQKTILVVPSSEREELGAS